MAFSSVRSDGCWARLSLICFCRIWGLGCFGACRGAAIRCYPLPSHLLQRLDSPIPISTPWFLLPAPLRRWHGQSRRPPVGWEARASRSFATVSKLNAGADPNPPPFVQPGGGGHFEATMFLTHYSRPTSPTTTGPHPCHQTFFSRPLKGRSEGQRSDGVAVLRQRAACIRGALSASLPPRTPLHPPFAIGPLLPSDPLPPLPHGRRIM